MSIRDEPCVAPTLDTWRNWERAGSWLWSPNIPWTAEQLTVVLDVLRPFARARVALFDGPPDAPLQATPTHRWSEDVAHDEFEEVLIGAVRAAATPITNIDIVVDLRVWVRTEASCTTPVLGWLRGAADLLLYFGDGDRCGALAMNHTLFLDGDFTGTPNTELHRLNQPLLRNALGAIESKLGPLTEVEGLPGVDRTGFVSLDSEAVGIGEIKLTFSSGSE